MEEQLIYVLACDGTPLMPTRRYGKVRRMLKSNKAKIVEYKPFTIRLLYNPNSKVRQEVIRGVDGGRTNIGECCIRDDGTTLYSAKAETRNKEIPDLMTERAEHRHASRIGERKVKKRQAQRNGTIMADGQKERMFPRCEKPVLVKDIKNSLVRYCHRVRPKGWLTPTANQLLETLLSLEEKCRRILPVTKTVVEVNKFAFMALEAEANGLPKPQGTDYQQGPMYGFKNQLEAIAYKQGNRCLLCGKPIEELNHIEHKANGGSNTVSNKVGLCEACHALIHHDQGAENELKSQVSGKKKAYAGTSIWNQVFPYYILELEKRYPGQVYLTNGWNTKEFREAYKLEKDHDIDAYAIACSVLDDNFTLDPPADSYQIKQYRRHMRANIYAEKPRLYKMPIVSANGKTTWKTVAKNRRKATAQEFDSLETWFDKEVQRVGLRQALRNRNQLKVIPSKRSYNEKNREMNGALMLHDGKVVVLDSRKNGGSQYKGYGEEKYTSKKYYQIIKHNTGLVYLR